MVNSPCGDHNENIGNKQTYSTDSFDEEGRKMMVDGEVKSVKEDSEGNMDNQESGKGTTSEQFTPLIAKDYNSAKKDASFIANDFTEEKEGGAKKRKAAKRGSAAGKNRVSYEENLPSAEMERGYALPRRKSSRYAQMRIKNIDAQYLELDEACKRRRKGSITERMVKDSLKGRSGKAQPNLEDNDSPIKSKKTRRGEKRTLTEDIEEEDKDEKVNGNAVSAHGLRRRKSNNVCSLSGPKIRKDEDGNEFESNMCHQCQRNDKGMVVRCTNCKTKRYCLPCMATWYPGMTQEAFAEKCPVCLKNCNCKSCLRLEGSIRELKGIRVEFSKDECVQYSKYILQVLLPFLRQCNAQQIREKETEAMIHGVASSILELQKVNCPFDERMNCGNCKTCIVDFHRSCANCSYNLCLACFQELRNESSKGGPNAKRTSKKAKRFIESGRIVCPTCNVESLELRHLLGENYISELLAKAEEIGMKLNLDDMPKSSPECCACLKTIDGEDIGRSYNVRKAASREGSDDNVLYNPVAAKNIEDEDLKHFQWHWGKGELVIVSNVLETTFGLSWEPMVMWRAFRQLRSQNEIIAVNCLDWSEVNVNIHQFFKEYMDLPFESGWPKILKLSNWPTSDSFEERLPRHDAEFKHLLPFKTYTNPLHGYLNLATKWPSEFLKPNMGPKACIAYGIHLELGRGDSVTKLHFDTSDSVNVLTHTQGINLTPESLSTLKKVRMKHAIHDENYRMMADMAEKKETEIQKLTEDCSMLGKRKIFTCEKPEKKWYTDGTVGDFKNGDEAQQGKDPRGNDCAEFEESDGGALWDIFRREDVPKLEEYIREQFKEFGHIYTCQDTQVVHPIHDQCFYLTIEHKKRLKQEYGVEPWTFVQILGDAVFIPAGCPYQVRNLKSCTNVALGFVSPESFSQCVRLTEEIRSLPQNHSEKEDKVEVKKMMVYAVAHALRTLDMHD
ncbi:unnamed protein product [Cuscuta epithymum]|uniref:JmjC domain-containing protein n=1 Tax=Cuscuta epithymum TaxID=186058 RepID=A0AAV0G6U0_9ASTE|nr:unnamed protein product [Cuscuta epithymum]